MVHRSNVEFFFVCGVSIYECMKNLAFGCACDRWSAIECTGVNDHLGRWRKLAVMWRLG